MRFAKALVVALLIPMIGAGVGIWILSDIGRELASADLPSLGEICSSSELLGEPAIRRICERRTLTWWLIGVSLAVGAVAVTIPLGIRATSVRCTGDRVALADLFPNLVRRSLLGLAGLIAAQAIVLAGAMMLAGVHFGFGIPIFVIGAIVLGGLASAGALLGAMNELGTPLMIPILGRSISRNDAPTLWGFVDRLADELDARPPTNIVAGLEPRFFVTAARVVVPGAEEPLSEETLYLSTALTRLLSRGEFAAIMGHELAHFSGDDAAYSLQFAPLYAGLQTAATSLAPEESDTGASDVAKFPARALLRYLKDSFTETESAISRDREFEADRIGAETSSPKELARALLKLTAYSQLWAHARSENVSRLRQGKATRNLSHVFQDLARYDIDQDNLQNWVISQLEQTVAHPTDSHPPTSERLKRLGVDPNLTDRADLELPDDAAVRLLDNYREIEEELTALEHNYMVALGAAEAEEQANVEPDHFLQASYALAASMVTADGSIDEREIALAENIGCRLFEDFDTTDFRERCRHPDDLPEPSVLAERLAEALPLEYRLQIFRYLHAIASADDEITPDEAGLIHELSEKLGVSLGMLDD